uniref:Uncharacterized protein n=1 Tax=Arundo donax TaxID=35708 RepID=A0A0A9BF09_ARUDO
MMILVASKQAPAKHVYVDATLNVEIGNQA